MNRHGKRIPEDVSVIGYDDVGFSDILHAPLTNIKQPVYQIGREAVKQMIFMIKEKEYCRQKVEFYPELIVRESVKDLNS